MLKKIGIILVNFLKSAKKIEIFDLLIVPGLITIILYLFFNNCINEFNKFAQSFNDTVITITSLLAAFGLASLSILVTSSSDNIKIAQEQYTDRVVKGIKISYYKLQTIRSFFSLLIQLGVLILAVINKFIMQVCNKEIILYFELYLLIVAIFAQTFVVISIYFLLGTPKNK